jgi:hemerythrin-like domain-containing protein
VSVISQPLRDEHKELLPHIEALRAAAATVEPGRPLAPEVRAAHEFLAQHLLAHALAEEEALYPVVARIMGAPKATATMSRDHEEVRRLTTELGGLLTEGAVSEAAARDLRRVLYGLYALVKLHFHKEEDVYLPLLDASLTEREARAMFESMEAAAGRAKAALAAGKSQV